MLETLRRDKNVQNRQLQTWLSKESFEKFEDEWRQQQELREDLKCKPDEILEYELRLKAATFTYSKADSASAKGRSAAAKMFSAADTEFERLFEYLQEQIVGDVVLERWLDRDVHYDASNAPHSSPENFPRVVTSRSRNRSDGGMLVNMRTKKQVKIDIVESEIEMLTRDDVEEFALFTKRQAALRKMKKLLRD